MYVIIIIIIIIIVILFILIKNKSVIYGGAVKKISGNIIIDTLNLANYLYDKNNINEKTIIKSIRTATKTLNGIYTDRIMFVIKDRDFTESAYIDFLQLAQELRIYIFLTKKYDDTIFDTHSSLGRDDFYCIYLANKYNCPIFTNDKLRDYKKLSHDVFRFKTIEFNYYKSAPIKDYINPRGMRLKSPKIIKIDTLIQKQCC